MIKQQHYCRPHRYRPNRQWGISLVPVMISIAIFTAIAVQYTLPKQQQQLRKDMLHNAQITAAQILQAALNHHIENGNWPQDVGTLVGGNRLDIANTNPWGNAWHFEPIPAVATNQGTRLITQAGSSQTAMALAARFGGIARVCNQRIPLCNATEAGGTWVHIGIAPP